MKPHPLANGLSEAKADDALASQQRVVIEDTRDWVQRAERQLTWYPAELIRADGKRMRIFVTNLSGAGCRLTGSSALRIGETYELLVQDHGMFRVQIRWVADGNAGAKFLD